MIENMKYKNQNQQKMYNNIFIYLYILYQKQEIDLKDIIANKNDIISELRKTEKRNLYILEMYEDEQQYRQQVEKKFNQLVIQKRDDDEKYNNLLQQHKELQDLYDDSSKRLSEIATEVYIYLFNF